MLFLNHPLATQKAIEKNRKPMNISASMRIIFSLNECVAETWKPLKMNQIETQREI